MKNNKVKEPKYTFVEIVRHEKITKDGLTLIAQMADTMDSPTDDVTTATMRWRIQIKKNNKIVKTGCWYQYYAGMCTLKYKGRTFILPTAYWEGSLAIEEVFEVI